MVFEFNQITIDTDQYRLSSGGDLVPVEPQVFDLLVFLIINRDRVVTREELLETLWSGKVVTDAALGVRIKDARKAVGDNGNQQKVIKTIHGRGYQFISEITQIDNQGGAFAFQDEKQLVPNEMPSIVVLPFHNIGGSSESDYLVHGISEEILSGLSRFREILVISLKSSILIGDQTTSPDDAANKLNVEYALTGSIQLAGNQVRITAKLIEGKSGHHIWSEQYDLQLDDIFRVQDEVTQKILNMLVGHIELNGRDKSLRKETSKLSAYDYVLLGRHYFHDFRCSREDLYRSRQMFEKAIDIDPSYAAAYAGLASTYLDEYFNGYSEDPSVVGERTIELAQRAVQLDDHNSLAQLVLAEAYWLVKADFDLARKKFQTAISLNPNYYWNYCIGCWFSVCAGDLEQSVIQAEEAIRRNPLLPDDCLYTLGFTKYLLQEYVSSIEHIHQMVTPQPENHACLAACHAQLGQFGEASKAGAEFRNQTNLSNMSPQEWHKYWSTFLKFKDRAPVDHLIEGLDKAGLVRH